MVDSIHIVCTNCSAVNRVPVDKDKKEAGCGKCKHALLSASARDVQGDLFTKVISRSDLPVVVDFWASWCGPCKSMAPEFQKAAAAHFGEVIYLKLNTEQDQHTAARFNIRSIPTMVLFEAGHEIARNSGAMSAEQIRQWLTAKL